MYKQEGDNIHTLRGAFGEVLATYKNGSHDYWNIVRPDGTVIGRREGSNRLYYHRDHLGSTRAVVNASGTVVQTYDYYPFGLEMPGRSLTSGSMARERFIGHERDEEVGLDYMQARRYAVEFGRFLSVDPHASNYPSLSPYVYVANNPLIFVDPDGRDFIIHTERDEDGNITGYRISGTYFVQEGDEASHEAISAAIAGINATQGTVRTGNFLQRLFGTGPSATVTFDLNVEYSSNAWIDGHTTEGGNVFTLMSGEDFNARYQGQNDPNAVGGVALTVLGDVADVVRVPATRSTDPGLTQRIQHEIGHTFGMAHNASPIMRTMEGMSHGRLVLSPFGVRDANVLGRSVHRKVKRSGGINRIVVH